MSFSVTGVHVCVVLFLFWLSHRWGRGTWLGGGYSWPQGWFHPAGVGLLAKARVVLGTWPPLVTNVVKLLRKWVTLSCWLKYASKNLSTSDTENGQKKNLDHLKKKLCILGSNLREIILLWYFFHQGVHHSFAPRQVELLLVDHTLQRQIPAKQEN